MNDEHIKEIVVAAINNGLLSKYVTNEETARELAKFINTLIEEINS